MRKPRAFGVVLGAVLAGAAATQAAPPKPAPKPPAKPGAAPAVPAGKDWSKQTAGLEFVVGFQKGMERGWVLGKPLMLFFTSITDPWAPKYGQRTFKDKAFLDAVDGYLPVLVDVDVEKEVAKALMPAPVLPTLVWVHLDGDTIFTGGGDLPIEMARSCAEVAHTRCPDEKKTEVYVGTVHDRDVLRAARKEGAVRPIVDAATALSRRKYPASWIAEAKAADAEMTKAGEARLAAAKTLAEGGKKEEAHKALAAIIEDYGPHAIGQAADRMDRALR